MRYLNKIVFLNSAHIPYSEIQLDGNVHFIGTQGVGKSTLLRAILFFYNADKLRLGIPKEKRSYDEFYLPYANSFIVYEVMRENGAYCVMAFKQQGRVAYRFIDAPYQSSWFVNERREVRADWISIRKAIGTETQISRIVVSYQEFRDIIFGNNRRPDLIGFRKYAIVESPNYQNIPRTIQNVFLNSKLDADFIKDTIIRSMNEEEVNIDLDVYRNQTKDFEQNYNDVTLWLDNEKPGGSPVQRQAGKVMQSYRDLLYMDSHIAKGRAELCYAEKSALKQRPLIDEEISRHKTELERVHRLQSEETKKYQEGRDKLIKEKGSVDADLKRAKQKQLEYEQMNIAEIIRRVEQKSAVTDELTRQQQRRQELTRAYDDVIAKYSALIERVDTDFRAFENAQHALVNEREYATNKQNESLMQTRRNEENEVYTRFEEKSQLSADKLQQLREEKSQQNNELLRIAHEDPYKEEHAKADEELNKLNTRAQELKMSIQQLSTQAASLRQEAGMKLRELELAQAQPLANAQKEKQEIEDQIARLESLIERRKGSLAEWLDRNKPAWKNTIGKIADEEKILYRDDLAPQVTNQGEASLYGVQIDLTALERNFRTPEELKVELAIYQGALSQRIKRINMLHQELAEQTEALKKQYNKRLREITDRQRLQESEQLQLPAFIKNAMAQSASWQKKTDDWREQRIAEIRTKQNDTAHRLALCEEKKKKLKADRTHRLKVCEKSYREKKLRLEQELNSYRNSIETEIKLHKQQSQERRKELEASQQAELNGKGADTATIGKYDARILQIQKELDYIEKHFPDTIRYQKDKEELFDREPQLRGRKKMLEDELATLEERFTLRSEKLNVQEKHQQALLGKGIETKRSLEEGLAQAAKFHEDSTFCPPDVVVTEERQTLKSCAELVQELKDHITGRMKQLEEFKRMVNLFKSNFSAKNTFSFRTDLSTEEDYLDFASNLCEFVDNNKILDFQKQISERYTHIIQRISKAVGELTQNEGEIHRTIGDINKDFERRNFAGVIRKIELRAQPSSDRLMQLLKEIKKFCDENEFNMGEVDLFSQMDLREVINKQAVRYLLNLMKALQNEPSRKRLLLTDTFKLEFRITENDNDTGWVEKISNVGSDGTDILVKAMVNIMLINVFKEKASHKFGEFRLHCMMDEIGKLHPTNVKGILDFANSRNILLINSSPTTYNVESYRYTYLLGKDSGANTKVTPLLKYDN